MPGKWGRSTYTTESVGIEVEARNFSMLVLPEWHRNDPHAVSGPGEPAGPILADAKF